MHGTLYGVIHGCLLGSIWAGAKCFPTGSIILMNIVICVNGCKLVHSFSFKLVCRGHQVGFTVKFSLLLVPVYFSHVPALCIAWASGGAALSRWYDPGFGVFALTFAGKRFSFPDFL